MNKRVIFFIIVIVFINIVIVLLGETNLGVSAQFEMAINETAPDTFEAGQEIELNYTVQANTKIQLVFRNLLYQDTIFKLYNYTSAGIDLWIPHRYGTINYIFGIAAKGRSGFSFSLPFLPNPWINIGLGGGVGYYKFFEGVMENGDVVVNGDSVLFTLEPEFSTSLKLNDKSWLSIGYRLWCYYNPLFSDFHFITDNGIFIELAFGL